VARIWIACAVVVGACNSGVPPLQTAEPGVVFTYPLQGQLDVPLGARIVVTFSDPVVESAVSSATLVGPAGPIGTPTIVDEKTVQFENAPLEPGTKYDVTIGGGLAPFATNLPSGPLLSFTTRSDRPRAAAPTLVAVNGGSPTQIDSFRPMFETSTIRLVFSEPLDPRTVAMRAGAIELLDQGGAAVPATMISNGIHVSIDPRDDLTAGSTYTLRLGNQLLDLGGQPLAPTTVTIVPRKSKGAAPIVQKLRTRQMGDPGPDGSRSGAETNAIVLDKPLIGREVTRLLASTLTSELGDPKALGGPIAFTIRRGQRLRASGLDIKLGGQIPVGLTTGDVMIELLTDGGGRLYRNPYQAAEQRPENDRAPLYVDLSLDVAVYAVDPEGNAALTQTIMGLQATGTAIATDGVLAIESVASMDMALLGVAKAPSNMVMELITDESATVPTDTTPPQFVASMPAQSEEQPIDAGIEIIFDEPIDIERARAGGIRLEDTISGPVATTIESHGASIVVRPLAPLSYSRLYRVVFSDVADVAGNKLTMNNLSFATPPLLSSDVPTTITAVHPGAPCALTAGDATSPGRCAGSDSADDVYQPFTLAANDPIEVAFSGPLRRTSVTRGTACNTGSFRVEEIDGAGGCVGAVPGTMMARDRRITFIPDQPWVAGKRYRLVIVSGSDTGCSGGDVCGLANAANFDPLNGTESGDAGGPSLSIVFTGAPPTSGTFMLSGAAPFTDINASGFVEAGEQLRDANRAALRIVGTSGAVSQAQFNGNDCVPSTPEKEACMYLLGVMPVDMGEVTTTCPLPGGATAASCVPVTLSAQAMYATSVSMSATALGISINTDTGTSVMRIREPASGPLRGYIIDRGGPTMVLALDLYLDAPDMSIPLASHDLHSKPMTVQLEGPVSFLADGRIAIALTNTADVPVVVNISTLASGAVQMIVPKGEMKLQLVSPPQRGVAL